LIRRLPLVEFNCLQKGLDHLLEFVLSPEEVQQPLALLSMLVCLDHPKKISRPSVRNRSVESGLSSPIISRADRIAARTR
jgi:hypothetical protein